jgi:hypothetical protein
MSAELDLFQLKWSTINFYDLVQIYRDLNRELEQVSHEYARSMDIGRKAYYQGALQALTSAQEKLLCKLVDLLEEYGYLQPLDYDYEEIDAKLRRARPIMELLVQDLWQ